MIETLWVAVAVAGLVALMVPVVLRPLLQRFGVFDVPNHRSSHSRPTLRGGGVGPLLGILIAGTLASLVLEGSAAFFVGVIVAAGVLMGFVGLADDIRGLRAIMRAGLQLVVGAAVAITLSAVTGIHWLWVPMAALFFAANVNFTNFMDGVNGISGLHGLVAGLAYAALGMLSGWQWLQFVGLVVAACFMAFLPWNLIRPRMFLGDVGSYLLGGVLGATAIAALAAGIIPLAVLAPLSIYWADAVATLLTRFRRGESLIEAHRTHAYQRLADTGLGHVTVSVLVGLLTAANAGMGWLVVRGSVSWPLGLAAILAVCLTYLLLPTMRGHRLPLPVTYELPSLEISWGLSSGLVCAGGADLDLIVACGYDK